MYRGVSRFPIDRTIARGRQQFSTASKAFIQSRNHATHSLRIGGDLPKKWSNVIIPTKAPAPARRHQHKFVPRKAAVKLTEKARNFFRDLLEKPPRPNVIGILLTHQQSGSGEPRMVFAFKFVTEQEIDPRMDEGVSLEVIEEMDASTGGVVQVPKPPSQSEQDGLPKLYVHHDAFLKVLGATVDVDTDTIAPILYDREGNRMDPNA